MPTAVRGRLVARVAEIHETLDRRGLIDPIIKTGSIGPDARAGRRCTAAGRQLCA
jgi:hypothetical protein